MRQIPETARQADWPRKVRTSIGQIIDNVRDLLARVSILEGSLAAVDEENSTTTPLAANATFTGSWVQNNNAQLAFNALSDEYAEAFVEFSIDGTSALQTLSKPYQLFADEGEFDALVKMPGRYHRIRVENGSVAQTSFGLLTSTAPNGLFPFSKSNRDSPVGFAYSTGNISSPTSEAYAILVDLDDRVNFPHHNTKSLTFHAGNFFIDRSSNAEGVVQIGVITRIDGTDADISFIQGVSFSGSSDREFPRDRDLNNPIYLTQSGGKLTRFVSLFNITTTLVNTGTTLASSSSDATAVTPDVGDLVLRYTRASGNFTASISGQYAGSAST